MLESHAPKSRPPREIGFIFPPHILLRGRLQIQLIMQTTQLVYRIRQVFSLDPFACRTCANTQRFVVWEQQANVFKVSESGMEEMR